MSLFRRLLIFGGLALVLLCGGGAALVGWAWNGTALSTAGEVAFERPLAVPPLAESTVDDKGKRVFDLTARAGRHDFGAGAVPTWGFNGDHLGPTLRANRGEQVVVNVRNELPTETNVHWHGMHLPAAMDGGPHQLVRPGTTGAPTWRVNQPAATLWYHPHPHGETAGQVYRGLAGMFIIDDPARAAVAQALPHRYGVDDIPLIVQDKRFGSDGELDFDDPFLSAVGVLGDTIAVNGTVGPYLDVVTERVRLRLLNGSNARVYQFGLADDRFFDVIGSDGGLLERPRQARRLPLSPGERAEIVVSVRPGERAVLRSTPPPMETDLVSRRFAGGADTLDILELRAADRLTPSPPVPAVLGEIPRLDPATAARDREFRFSGNSINGARMDMDRIDAEVGKDTTEVWRLTAADGTPHSFHLHDAQFQVLSVGGQEPPPYWSGWKDTILLPANREVRVIARFADYADPDTPYMFHCHVLDHEDKGMMGQFVVVEQPGTGAGADHDHGTETSVGPERR